MRIAVGLSGGVDSTVTACLLREQGHEVVGVTMRIWDGDTVPESYVPVAVRSGCYGPGEVHELELVAALSRKIGIEHHVVPLADEYRRLVLDYFRREYLNGRTPNPCVVCNRYVKFGLLPERLRSAGVQFDMFATGHYARVELDSDTGLFRLRRGADPDKDQSYFIFHLGQSQLSQLILPLGARTKKEVIKLALKYGFPELADQPESQDFMEGGDYGSLFRDTDARPGPIVDENGRELGQHRGIINYTIGQRTGLNIAASHRLYVKELRAETNTVVVAARNSVMSANCIVTETHWIAGQPPGDELECQVRLRYRHAGVPAYLELQGRRTRVSFPEPQFAVTPGQAAVFYRGDEVLGGGWISMRGDF